ncbi:molybdopterin-binding protein [Kiloniella sp. EL199]|uniref:competence/damage-inducible protein A n=1 Tax=Kiloniella sp. EL199 TaxID=2107581 RepID=UPI000EA065C1|nr:molybdopterin-binding protein [Kiloniella sp. EL199]
MERIYKACLVIIGNEILSGRTQDSNLSFLGEQLNKIGIRMEEARVVPDIPERIINTVNEVRSHFDYVFTTGGIGPTHDDITSQCVADAFAVPLILHPDAHKAMLSFYGEEQLTEARLRMAHVPQGARLIENDISIAPGYQIENVFVLAGVPKIMQSMFAKLAPDLTGGKPMISRTLTSHAKEGEIAKDLGDIQRKYPDVDVGSYPFMGRGGTGVRIVMRSTDEGLLMKCEEEVDVVLNSYT